MLYRWMMILVGVAGLSIFGSAACSDETTTGPMFGDLEFTPSFENIGNGRTIELILSNAGSVELGSIVVGHDFPKDVDFPDAICTMMSVTVAPTSIASLAPGADAVIDIELDMSGVDPNNCEPAQYDLDVFAAVDGQTLGGATVRFNWDGTPP